jgi:hypothetical protein
MKPAEPRLGLGMMVRQIWVTWAREQPHPKLSWLLPWDRLDAGQQEVDMRIGAALFEAGQRSMSAPVSRAALETIVGAAHDWMFPGMDHTSMTKCVVDRLLASGAVTVDSQK